HLPCPLLFFFHDPATTELYTLSLHDALPISNPDQADTDGDGAGDLCQDSDHDGYPFFNDCNDQNPSIHPGAVEVCNGVDDDCNGDRKSTRLNSSHVEISYAVFCLKKKKTKQK